MARKQLLHLLTAELLHYERGIVAVFLFLPDFLKNWQIRIF